MHAVDDLEDARKSAIDEFRTDQYVIRDNLEKL